MTPANSRKGNIGGYVCQFLGFRTGKVKNRTFTRQTYLSVCRLYHKPVACKLLKLEEFDN